MITMCDLGDEVMLYVPVPAHLSHDGKFRCIAPIVEALNRASIYTAGCCCGHGQGDGTIFLHDGRTLRIVNPADPAKL